MVIHLNKYTPCLIKVDSELWWQVPYHILNYLIFFQCYEEKLIFNKEYTVYFRS